jgi:leucyl aminopeptidase
MPLEISCTNQTPAALCAELPVAVPVGKKPSKLPVWVGTLPPDLRGCLSVAFAAPGFEGKVGETVIVRASTGAAILVGIGSERVISTETARRVYGSLIQCASKAKIPRLAAPLFGGRDATESAEAAAVGAKLGNYQFADYRTDRSKLPVPVEALLLWEPDAGKRRKAAGGIATGTALAESTCRVRDLVNTPANDLNPQKYAMIAARWCDEAKVKLQVLGPREIERAGMAAILAVGGGSTNEPRFLIATYLGRKRQPKAVDVALVGKGVTFDSGGISIKPSADMWEMRGDMMGSAVVMAGICAAAKMKLPLNLVALAPLVENLPSGTAYRPGDVIRTLSGQTIEIISTDAEGRLILADALTYAQRFQPKTIVDVATLTGAIGVALGDACCGIFTEKDDLARRLEKAAAASGERVWRMPLFEDYDEKFSSDVADMKNSGGREGGASIAARLLRKFTGDYPWVHIDIAGVDLEKKGRPCCPKGATGFGARLVLEFLRQT